MQAADQVAVATANRSWRRGSFVPAVSLGGALALACGVVLATVAGLLLASLVQELRAVAAGTDPASGHYDFLAFYSAGHFVWLGRVADLYLQPSLLAAYQHTLVPQDVGAAGYMPFLYPPFAAVLQAPLALLPEPVARLAWFGFNTLLALAIISWITRPIAGRWRIAAGLALLGTYPVFQTLVQGQWSLVMLLGTLAGVHFAGRGRHTWAGACLSILWLKPQLAVIVLAALLFFRYWRIAGSMVGATGVVALATLPLVGVRAYTAYVPFLVNVSLGHVNGGVAGHPGAWEGDLALVQGLNGIVWGFFRGAPTMLVDALWVLAIALTAVILRRVLLRVRPGFGDLEAELMLAATLALVLLLDPHLLAQDIVLLFVIVPLLAPWLKAPLRISVIAGLAVTADAPLLDSAFPLHLFTLAIWLAVIAVGLALAREDSRSPSTLRGFALPRAGRPAERLLSPVLVPRAALEIGRSAWSQRSDADQGPATGRSRPDAPRLPVPRRTTPLPERPG